MTLEPVFCALMFASVLGLPLLAIGIILRLCEWGWEKDCGELGSLGFLVLGSLLSLPAAIYLAAALLS
ncbi:MAG TPA: hypothetical protein VKS79_15130 [Gemmataceae bacterium]|nr:hypothetical protein [Gemmataceae bacterium]